MKRLMVVLVCVVVVAVAGTVQAETYRILHKQGAIYNTDTGKWTMTTPPYYPGTEWTVDMVLDSQGVTILHKDGALWSTTGGWDMSTPPYYPGSAYAQALNVTTVHGYYTKKNVAGVYGENTSTLGRGVYGVASASSSANYGVYGESASDEGYGVYGTAPKYGVYGVASASSAPSFGVVGENGVMGGTGVLGAVTAGVSGIGVEGVCQGVGCKGVWGYAAVNSGDSRGVTGLSDSPDGCGVQGTNSASGGEAYGVSGCTASIAGRGVYGYAYASSGETYGVYGECASPLGRGVYGKATAVGGDGVQGSAFAESGLSTGVVGYTHSTEGYSFYAIGVGGKYGPFTGAHDAKLSPDFPDEVQPGLIVSATGQAQIRQNPDGSVNLSSTLPTIKLADTPQDKAVFGVLVAETTLREDYWYKAQAGERFAIVNALGEGRVWVADINGAIEAGDYITTSAIPGYGQRQDDDLLHSYTLGKATETVDWDTVTEVVEINGKTYKVYLIAVVYTSG